MNENNSNEMGNNETSQVVNIDNLTLGDNNANNQNVNTNNVGYINNANQINSMNDYNQNINPNNGFYQSNNYNQNINPNNGYYQSNNYNQNFNQYDNSTNKKNKNTILIVCAIVAVIMICIGLLIVPKIVNMVKSIINQKDVFEESNETFEGDKYTLSYSIAWTEGTSKDKKVLYYLDNKSILLPLSTYTLDKMVLCDFDLQTCRDNTYLSLYEASVNEFSKSTNGSKVFKGTGFTLLKNNIYYASFNIGTSSSDLTGKNYIVVSKEKNAMVSFVGVSNILSLFDSATVNLLRTIEISQIPSTNNPIENIPSSSSSWNTYSNLRNGAVGRIIDISGGWQTLSDSETYWVFKGNEFWWYKSYNNLDDDYWYGTYDVVIGREGIEKAGLNTANYDKIKSSSSGSNVKYVTVTATPSKIISGGIDKTSTNYKEGEKWVLVWALVDHGSEGIEAQVINASNFETSYYFKKVDY